jgi:LacI family gluconate utilization system Gnt-I transcriptional repressor
MEAAGRSDPSLITTTTRPSSVSMGADLFQQAFAKTQDLDALVCNNDDLAMGVLFACHRAGLRVPEKISLAGFNDLEMMAVAFPSITSIRTPRYEIGRRAIAMVQAAMAGDRPESAVVDLGFELKIRESSVSYNRRSA